MNRIILTLLALASPVLSIAQISQSTSTQRQDKIIVYQVLTRLFGNQRTTNKPWGTAEENGVGKFADFTDKALREIKALGVTHIWYTGVPHHALVRDYTTFGISNDDPDVVKGRAGSPYAVKDYFNVNPDLALDPANRMAEFEALIRRSHRNGLKVVIDIVPNHVARRYEGLTNPPGVRDFGADDNKNVEYSRDNNFYYIPRKAFEVPEFGDYRPLNGEAHAMIDGKFEEFPAKWTGNGSRRPKPDANDWYETVKVNHGIRPDGTKDFPELPEGYDKKGILEHYEFWKGNEVPDSWKKFRDIALYWTEKGVDGFRFDRAEMVSVEFWSYMNSNIKMHNPDAFLLAEIDNPAEYRNYIRLGKIDYLYDKVGLYDKLKDILHGKASADEITGLRVRLSDISGHMLHFLDHHDEQRLASPEFAGSGRNGRSLMVLSTTISSSPMMVYFGQEVGEAGNEDAGFGKRSRTSIFDYIGVPAHQRWMNGGKFDGGQSSAEERELRSFYKSLLNFALRSKAIRGSFAEIQSANRTNAAYPLAVYSYVRWEAADRLVISVNLSREKAEHFILTIPADVISQWKLRDGKHKAKDPLTGRKYTIDVRNGVGTVPVTLQPSESVILKL